MWNIGKGDMYSMSSFLMNHRPQYLTVRMMRKHSVKKQSYMVKKLTEAVSKAVKQSLKCAILTEMSHVSMGVSVSQ